MDRGPGGRPRKRRGHPEDRKPLRGGGRLWPGRPAQGGAFRGARHRPEECEGRGGPVRRHPVLRAEGWSIHPAGGALPPKIGRPAPKGRLRRRGGTAGGAVRAAVCGLPQLHAGAGPGPGRGARSGPGGSDRGSAHLWLPLGRHRPFRGAACAGGNRLPCPRGRGGGERTDGGVYRPGAGDLPLVRGPGVPGLCGLGHRVSGAAGRCGDPVPVLLHYAQRRRLGGLQPVLHPGQGHRGAAGPVRPVPGGQRLRGGRQRRHPAADGGAGGGGGGGLFYPRRHLVGGGVLPGHRP